MRKIGKQFDPNKIHSCGAKKRKEHIYAHIVIRQNITLEHAGIIKILIDDDNNKFTNDDDGNDVDLTAHSNKFNDDYNDNDSTTYPLRLQ